MNRLLDIWLDEDLGRGDLTLVALPKKNVAAEWITKQEGVFCGSSLAERIFQKLDSSIHLDWKIHDGQQFKKHQRILEINGPATALLAGERTALNIAMRLSGIATATSKLVIELEGTNVRLADTRKTTPGLRIFEKYAFSCGGGINHRLGLDDAAMVKENHLAWGGDIGETIKVIRSKAPWTSKIIVEAETQKQAEEGVLAGADGILLDEIQPEIMHDLIPHLRNLAANRTSHTGTSQIIIEASGINPMYLKKYAHTGVDLISTSAPMTMSTWSDFSMRFR